MSKRTPRPPTLAELFKRMQGAEIDLRMQNEKFEARRAAYQQGFIPNYVSTAQDAYNAAKKAYDDAVESEKPT